MDIRRRKRERHVPSEQDAPSISSRWTAPGALARLPNAFTTVNPIHQLGGGPGVGRSAEAEADPASSHGTWLRPNTKVSLALER